MNAESNTVEGQARLASASSPPAGKLSDRERWVEEYGDHLFKYALSPSCRQASRLQSEALDHKLPILQRVGLRIHLFLCQWCRRYGKQIRFLRDAARDLSDERAEPAPQKLCDPARERMKRRLSVEEE